MSIAPEDNWKRLRERIPVLLSEGMVRIGFRLLVGRAETQMPSIMVEEGDTDEAILRKLVELIEEETEDWPPQSHVIVRCFAYAKGGARLGASFRANFAVNDEPGEDGERPAAADLASGMDVYRLSGEVPSAEELAKEGGVVNAPQMAMSRDFQFVVRALLESLRRFERLCMNTMSRAQSIAENAQVMLREQTEQVLDAQLASKTAQLDADHERAVRAIDQDDREVKREMVKMFSGNLKRAVDLMFMSATGTPPDDPELQKQFLLGFVRNNPTVAADLARSIGLNPTALLGDLTGDPDKLFEMMKKLADENPEQAMSIGTRLFDHITQKTEEREAAKGDPKAAKGDGKAART